MSKNCLVTKLTDSVSNPDLKVLGEMVVTISPKDASKSFAVIDSGGIGGDVEVRLEGAYFCKSYTDSTPLNGTIDESRSAVFAEIKSSWTHGRKFIYFEGASATARIMDKYKFIGFFNSDADNAYYNIVKVDFGEETLEYCDNWQGFTMPSEGLYDVDKVKIRRVISGNGCISGDVSDISFAQTTPATLRGYLYLTDITGTVDGIPVFGSLSMSGDYSFNLNAYNKEGLLPNVLSLSSKNVEGDITNLPDRIRERLTLQGLNNNYNHVTCSDLRKGFTSTIIIRSDALTLSMLKNIASVQANMTGRASNFSMSIYSTLFTFADVQADSELWTDLQTLASSTTASITINGTKVAAS